MFMKSGKNPSNVKENFRRFTLGCLEVLFFRIYNVHHSGVIFARKKDFASPGLPWAAC